ncbi:LOW QUALITY PROTEIN: Hypothetical protein PHPALM_10016 [Phytophthora palmivora]|uniref:Retrotransposon gag domain-containing protein n=1 Tax=Phytophthora palmivora TaxID=4796 RepID=A0A2P4Y5S1_9STRA|nr:LOW QUALITY PROTEIN: Hypothetical protein PHPALM_10016 [Phytophthora palmivora]
MIIYLCLNQCVRKNASVWFERYLTDDTTTKLWSAVKNEMKREFREPNFDDKIRNHLLTIRQTGVYPGYVSKFRELQRIVRLDELTAINLFVNGLTNNEVKKSIQRKQPATLTDAVRQGFLEWDVQDDKMIVTKANNNILTKKYRGAPTKSNRQNLAQKGNQNSQPPRQRNTRVEPTICPHCKRGVHREEDCWVKYPEKKPLQLQRKQQLHQQICSLLETLVVGDGQHSSSTASQPSN